ncbi:MAG: anaerobic ribonucleoside-triphosphate reductase [Candidatus Omnitrophota bacterium]
MKQAKCQVEVFSRVTGFFRPVQSWNEGKAEEFKDRKTFKLDMENGFAEHENSRVTESIAG